MDNERIILEPTEGQLNLLERAAKLEGLTLEEFVLKAAFHRMSYLLHTNYKPVYIKGV